MSDIDIFEEFANSLDRVMQYMNIHDLEYLQHQLNDQKKWQSFVDHVRDKLEMAIFTKEFASDCSMIPSEKLQDIGENDGRFNVIIKKELDDRVRRQAARDDVEQYVYNYTLNGYHNLHGRDYTWMSYWSKIFECIKYYPPYESLDKTTRFVNEWCAWELFQKSIGRFSEEERAMEIKMLERVYKWGLETHYCNWLEALFSNVTAKSLFPVMEHLIYEHCVHIINFIVQRDMKPTYDRVVHIIYHAYVNHGTKVLNWDLAEDLVVWINITRGMLNLGINVYKEFETVLERIPSTCYKLYPIMLIKCLEHVTDIPQLSQIIQNVALCYIKYDEYRKTRQHMKVVLTHVTCPMLKTELAAMMMG